MALAALVRDAEPPLCALGAAVGIDVMGLVAVVAGCIGVRLVFPVGARMDRFHVLVDLLNHHPQARVFLGLVFALCRFPQRFMAADATDFVGYACLVRNLGNVHVAFDALPLAVYALSELVLDHVQRTRVPVRARRRKPLVAVTGQTGRIGWVADLRIRGFAALRGVRRIRVLLPCNRRSRHTHCASQKPRC